MRAWPFLAAATIVAAIVFGLARYLDNDYVFFAGYVVLQFIVLATAWNILGGYCGYVNFGSAAFFALGAYTSVFFHKAYPLPIPVLMVIGGVVSGIVESLTATFYGPSWAPAGSFGFLLLTLAFRPAGLHGR